MEDGAAWLPVLLAFLLEPGCVLFSSVGDWGGGMWRGVQFVINALGSMDRVILFMISSFPSAVTCLQWPAEHVIVFGLAEGKVKEEEKHRRRYGWG